MKKSIFIAAFITVSFIACNNNTSADKSGSEQEQSTPAINQDSIDKAHGHSHDAPQVNKDSADKAHGHSHDAPQVNQDSIDKAHGHKH